MRLLTCQWRQVLILSFGRCYDFSANHYIYDDSIFKNGSQAGELDNIFFLRNESNCLHLWVALCSKYLFSHHFKSTTASSAYVNEIPAEPPPGSFMHGMAGKLLKFLLSINQNLYAMISVLSANECSVNFCIVDELFY